MKSALPLRRWRIHTQEKPLVKLMIGHFALALLSMTMLQSVHWGLFLDAFGAEALPFYFFGKGLLLLIVSLIYSLWVVPHFNRRQEMLGAVGLMGTALLLTWSLDGSWLYLPLSIGSEVFISIFSVQCWALYSDCMDSRQSKRLMPLVGAGGTLGAIIGGLLTGLLVHSAGPENLLIVCAIGLTLVGWFSQRLVKDWLHSAAPSPVPPVDGPQGQIKRLFHEIFSQRLLLLFMLIILGMKLIVNLSEYQMQFLLKASYNKAEITAWMGMFLASMHLLTLAIQLGLENRLLQRYGPLVGLAWAPLVSLMGALGFMALPRLGMIAGARIGEQMMQRSIYKTSVNLVYLVFPSEVRRRLRITINGLLELSAIIPLLFLTLCFREMPIHWLSAYGLGACLLVLGLIWEMRKPYQTQLQQALRERQLRSEDELDEGAPDYAYTQMAQRCLDHSDSQQIRFGLELLHSYQLGIPVASLEKLWHHPDPEIRASAAQLIGRYGKDPQIASLLVFLAQEQEPSVRVGALQALAQLATESHVPALLPHLRDPDPQVQAETLRVLFTRGGLEGILRGGEHLKQWIRSQTPALLCQAAYVMGEIGSGYFRKDMQVLLRHDHEEVVKSALVAVGKTPHRDWALPVSRYLSHPRLRATAIQSLRQMEAVYVLPELQRTFASADSLPVQKAVLQVCEGLPTPEVIASLIVWLSDSQGYLRARILRTLHVLARRYHLRPQGFEKPLQVLQQSLLQEGYTYLEILYLLDQETVQPRRVALLREELRLRMGALQDTLFMLLGLRYDPKEVYKAHLNYRSGEAHYRALSLDLLAHLLGRQAPAIVTFLEEQPLPRKLQLARTQELLPAASSNLWWEHTGLHKDPLLSRMAAWSRHTHTGEDPMLDIVYILRQSALFAGLTVEQLQPVAQVCQPRDMAAGHTLFTEGAPGDMLYILRSGSVEVSHDNKVILTLQAPEVFGEVEVLNAAPRLATIRTREACQLLTISRSDFIDLIEDYPDFTRGLVEILFQRLRDALARKRT
jgi:HEAT repeat protein/MFS family permease/predicted DNA-binding transcriptional regulator AlpA